MWCSGLTRCPVKAETEGSNPFIPAKPPGQLAGRFACRHPYASFARGESHEALLADADGRHDLIGGWIDGRDGPVTLVPYPPFP